MSKKLAPAFLWIIIFQLIGYLIGLMTQANIPLWYQSLDKSTLNPPEIVFPIVWSILYIMLALAGWHLWENRIIASAKKSLFIYSIQIIMNWAWTPIFFQFHLIQLGFYWIIVMAALTLVLILTTWQRFRFAAVLLIPYWCWLTFAAYLNWAIYMKN